jgi:ornithine cyclodeaminase/alanine dehydrogenase-like protein (mu-crystallin family)
MTMRILNARHIAALVPLKGWIDAMEQAMVTALGDGYRMPPRPHYDYQGNTLLLMPCFLPDYFGTKLVSVFPGNTASGLPAVYGTMILNDGSTGEPLAMLNGTKLTAMRTGAVGAVGVRHLASPKATVLGIVGAGVQGLHQALMACRERPIQSIWVYDPLPGPMEQFKTLFQEEVQGVDIQAAPSIDRLLDVADVVVTTTTATAPVLPAEPDRLAGKTYIGIGSFKPDMQEFPDTLFQMADTVFCDTEHAVHETGDLINPLQSGSIKLTQVIPAGRLINGEVKRPASDVQIWKSVGMALFDLVAAVMLYQEARTQNIGQMVDV